MNKGNPGTKKLRCPHCKKYIENMETMKIPELNIEVTKPKDWDKPYNQIKAPKGWRMITVPELWFILDNSKYLDEFLGDYKRKWHYFACEQTHYDQKNNYSRWLYLDGNLVLGSDGRYLADSGEGGRVVFVSGEATGADVSKKRN